MYLSNHKKVAYEIFGGKIQITKFEIEHAETEMMLTRVVTLCNYAEPFFEFVILILHWQVESFVSFRKPET